MEGFITRSIFASWFFNRTLSIHVNRFFVFAIHLSGWNLKNTFKSSPSFGVSSNLFSLKPDGMTTRFKAPDKHNKREDAFHRYLIEVDMCSGFTPGSIQRFYF